MQSFGIWYKEEDCQGNNENEVENKGNEAPKFSLHFNLWFLDDITETSGHQRKRPAHTCLDVGIKIKQFRMLDELIVYFPFEIKRENIEDLSTKMSDKSTAMLIFNDDCEVETINSYTCVKTPKKEDLLIFPMNGEVIDDIYSIESTLDESYLLINIKKYKKYLDVIEKLTNFKDIYLRFRIKNIDFEDQIYFDSEPLNRSFDSAFSGTRIIDFKVNEKRNINEKIQAKMLLKERKWAKLNKVHFLIMEPSSYDLTSFADHNMNNMSCRELEEELWNDYLGEDGLLLNGHVLAYHWKTKDPGDSFSCLVKVNYSKTHKKMIIGYIAIVLALGMASSTIVSGICSILSAITKNAAGLVYAFECIAVNSIVVLILSIVALILQKRKKVRKK